MFLFQRFAGNGEPSRRQGEASRDVGLGIGKDVIYLSAFGHPPVFQYGDAVADFFDDLHFMRDEDDRDAQLRIELFEKLEDLLRRLRIQRACRLVTEQDFRIACQRSCDGDAESSEG